LFIFDEAQLSYCDGDLWNNFFKIIHEFSNCRVIVFASYGSPASQVSIAGTPIFIMDHQRITLCPTQYNDDLPSAGLLFTQPEFDDLVKKLYPRNRFDETLLTHVFDLTRGHIGALCDFLKIILSHSVSALHVETSDHLTSYFSHTAHSAMVLINFTLGLRFWKKLVHGNWLRNSKSPHPVLREGFHKIWIYKTFLSFMFFPLHFSKTP